MFAPANQPRFTLTVEGAQFDLKVLEFTGKEAISQPFALTWSWSVNGRIWILKACCTVRRF